MPFGCEVTVSAMRCAMGLEPNPEAYIGHMVYGFREVRRVLRSDATLWLNMGDSYASKPFYDGDTIDPKWKQARNRGRNNGPNRQPLDGFKPKDLIGVPWLLIFALRADGWYLRSDIIWAKPNPMPESVTDRPTKAHEYLFLLTKSSRYFYDAEAIKEPCTGNAHRRSAAASEYPGDADRDDNRRRPGVNPKARIGTGVGWGTGRTPREKQNPSFSESVHGLVESRNKRSVWEIPTHPYPEAHFATFPPKLVEPCILAGTSEKGCCPKCGAPWERVTEQFDIGKQQKMTDGWDTGDGGHGTVHRNGRESGETGKSVLGSKTVGWQPTCRCAKESCCHECGDVAIECEDCPQITGRPIPYDPIPCKVLDPFSGAGTTGLVATRLHRDFIGIELNPEYLEMSKRRIEQDAPLFNLQQGRP